MYLIFFIEKSQDDSSESSDSSAVQKLLNQQPKIIGVLPGLGAYDNDTSDSETSSSDSDCDFKLVHRKIKIHIEQQWKLILHQPIILKVSYVIINYLTGKFIQCK